MAQSGGRIGGRVRSAAKTESARAASRAPRPGRRAYDVEWIGGDGPPRATLSQIVSRAKAKGIEARLITHGQVVGRVRADGRTKMRAD